MRGCSFCLPKTARNRGELQDVLRARAAVGAEREARPAAQGQSNLPSAILGRPQMNQLDGEIRDGRHKMATFWSTRTCASPSWLDGARAQFPNRFDSRWKQIGVDDGRSKGFYARSAVFAPASCSRRTAMICSSVYLPRFIVRPSSEAG